MKVICFQKCSSQHRSHISRCNTSWERGKFLMVSIFKMHHTMTHIMACNAGVIKILHPPEDAFFYSSSFLNLVERSYLHPKQDRRRKLFCSSSQLYSFFVPQMTYRYMCVCGEYLSALHTSHAVKQCNHSHCDAGKTRAHILSESWIERKFDVERCVEKLWRRGKVYVLRRKM